MKGVTDKAVKRVIRDVVACLIARGRIVLEYKVSDVGGMFSLWKRTKSVGILVDKRARCEIERSEFGEGRDELIDDGGDDGPRKDELLEHGEAGDLEHNIVVERVQGRKLSRS